MAPTSSVLGMVLSKLQQKECAKKSVQELNLKNEFETIKEIQDFER